MNLKRLIVSAVGSILGVVLLAAPAIQAQSLSSADRESTVKYLEKTRDAVEASTKGLSDAQSHSRGTGRHQRGARQHGRG